MKQESNPIKQIPIKVSITDAHKRTIVALWLVFLYVLCMAFVMSSLSGALFQAELSKIEKIVLTSDSNSEQLMNSATLLSPYSVKDLTKPNSKETEYYSLNEIISLYKFATIGASPDILFRYSYLTAQQIEKVKTQAKQEVEDFDKELKDLAKDRETNEQDATLIRENIRRTNLTLELLTGTESQSAGGLPEDLFKNSKLTEKQRENFNNELKKLNNDKENNKENANFARENKHLANSTLDYFTIIESHPNIIPYLLKVDNFNRFFEPIKKLLKVITLGTLADHFWTYPRPILKLNLILSMGILGSLIFVTIEFLRDPLKHSWEMYLFRPFLGMIVALAMYVMIKSGQSTLFNISERELSPFFISFLGIISGMLAEEAYRRISFTGSSLFTAGTDTNTTKSNFEKEPTNPKKKEP